MEKEHNLQAGKSRRAIYGLFVGKRCVYVGQSIKPFSSRLRGHRSSGKQFDMLKVFRWVDRKWDADRIERQVMQAYWRRGEAGLSKGYNTPNLKITAEGKGEFYSWLEAASAFGVCVNTIKNWEKYGDWYGPDCRPGGKLLVQTVQGQVKQNTVKRKAK